MIHIALYKPEIPPNTGNIIRLCANTGAQLHLIHPLGFALDDKRMRRAGLDYHEWARVIHHQNTEAFLQFAKNKTVFSCTTKATQSYHEVSFPDEAVLLFGQETKGLPDELRHNFSMIRIPMKKESRSLNLSNAVSIILFEALRQHAFCELR